MTKNLTTLSVALLGKFLDSRGKPVSGRLAPPEDIEGEKEALQNLVEGTTWQSCSGVRVFDFMHQGAYCLALTLVLSDDDLLSLDAQSEGTIKPAAIPGSIFLFLANCLNLRPTSNDPFEVEEYVVGPANDECGVELEVVKRRLEGISVFQLSEASIFRLPTSGRYVGNYICTFDPHLNASNRLSPRSLEIIREIFLQDKDRLIEDNLFEAMKTPLLHHAFLEIYRTLEFVFVLPRANALLEQLRKTGGTLDMRVLDFARHCNKELGWKRVERDSIGKLFQEYAESNFSAFEILHRDCNPFAAFEAAVNSAVEKRQAFVDKIAGRYYELRNQVAHQFWPEEIIPCVDADWQALIEFTLNCIAYVYAQHLTEPS